MACDRLQVPPVGEVVESLLTGVNTLLLTGLTQCRLSNSRYVD